MTIADILSATIKDRGVPFSTIGQKTGLKTRRLYDTLGPRKRLSLRADELVILCEYLQLGFDDFRCTLPKKQEAANGQ